MKTGDIDTKSAAMLLLEVRNARPPGAIAGGPDAGWRAAPCSAEMRPEAPGVIEADHEVIYVGQQGKGQLVLVPEGSSRACTSTRRRACAATIAAPSRRWCRIQIRVSMT